MDLVSQSMYKKTDLQNEAFLPWFLKRYIGNFTRDVCDNIDYFYVNVFHDPVYKIG